LQLRRQLLLRAARAVARRHTVICGGLFQARGVAPVGGHHAGPALALECRYAGLLLRLLLHLLLLLRLLLRLLLCLLLCLLLLPFPLLSLSLCSTILRPVRPTLLG